MGDQGIARGEPGSCAKGFVRDRAFAASARGQAEQLLRFCAGRMTFRERLDRWQQKFRITAVYQRKARRERRIRITGRELFKSGEGFCVLQAGTFHRC